MITTVRSRAAPDGVELLVDRPDSPGIVSFTATGATLEPSADAALAAMLIPAMGTRSTIAVEDPVSPRLLGAVPRIQAIVRNWEQRFPVYGRYRTVEVQARARTPVAPRPRRRVAAFFTGGVDSFYTLARHRDEIDALVYVQGFDVGSGDPNAAMVTQQLRAAAAEAGKPLVEVTTDLRSLTDRHASWIASHGSALACVALLLAGEYEQVYVPATLTYAHLIPLGSHPLLDPLWSTEDLEVVHDGCEASRLDKLAVLADDEVVRRHLRVCWQNRPGRYNCGTCEKCLRTIVALRALGVLESFPTFPDAIDARALARIDLPDITYTWEASLALLQERGTDPLLARAVDRHLHHAGTRLAHRGMRLARRAVRKLRRLGLSR